MHRFEGSQQVKLEGSSAGLDIEEGEGAREASHIAAIY